MKPFYLFLTFSLTTFFIFSQEMPEFVSQTPEAAALSKYSEYPVGSFTGVPSINVPLYNLVYGDISLPIALSYHAGGFKVNEEASWVGLGWTLSINGAITRSVNGADDFNGDIGTSAYHNIGSSPNNGATPWIVDIMEGCLADNGCAEYGSPNAPGGNGFNSSAGDLVPAFSGSHSNRAQVNNLVYDYDQYTSSGFDWEPDVYSINILGINGKFVLDQHQNVYFLDKQDVEITKTINGWKARSNDGFQYFFEMKETTTNYSGKELNGAWYVTKIVSPTNRVVEFKYDVDQFDSWQHTYSESAISDSQYITNPTLSVDSNITSLKYKRVYLSTVEFNGGYIELERDQTNLREDIKNGERLKAIKIYDSLNLSSPIKEFEFVTNYFETGSTARGYFDTNFMNSTDYSFYTKRLRLDEVIEKNGALTKKHQFNYSSIALPNKDSYSIDHWGYYNGKTNGRLISAIEGIYPFLIFNGTETCAPLLSTDLRYIKYPGANRSTDPDKVKANILKEIIYPTGGKTTFDFEANDYDPGSTNEYEYVNFQEHLRRFCISTGADYEIPSTTFPFSFPSETISVHDPKVSMVVYPVSGNITFTSNMYFEIDSPDYFKRYYFDQYASGNSLSHEDTGLPENLSGPINLDIYIPESNEDKTAIITFSCRIRKELVNNKKYAGGLRIKRITHSENGISPDVVKKYGYNYTGTNQEDLSYGILKTPLKYWTGVPREPNSNFSKLNFSSSTATSLSYDQNNHIGYSKIVEYFGENNEGGRIEYNYTNSPNIVYEDNVRPAGVPNTVSYFLDGKLANKKVYDDGGNKVAEDIYNYSKLDEQIVKGIFQEYDVCNTAFYGKGKSHYYPIYSRWVPLTSQIHRVFNSSNSNYLETSSVYQYNEDNLLPKLVKTTNSNGETEITKTFYPNDVTSATSLLGASLGTSAPDELGAIDRLKSTDLYINSVPIQVEKYLDLDNDDLPESNELVSLQRTNYKDWGNDIVLPKDVQTLKGVYNQSSNPFQERIVYHDYDSYGNPVELSKSNGTTVAYLWGYDGRYPVAKVENATYASIVSALSQQNLDTIDDGANQTTMISILNTIRTTLTNALVTTYTYDPMVGVTSMTDPKGYTVFYEYDGLHRLKTVKDADGNIVNENTYSYKL